MKATDLMIGDLVTYTGDDEGPITASIEGINEDSDFGIKILGTCERIEDIEPIPLTAEILQKNGFYVTMSNDIAYGDGLVWLGMNAHCKGYFCISSNPFGTNYDEIYNEIKAQGRFKFVHELQHALRLCGLNELADYFKI